jgi:hypothetical protein
MEEGASELGLVTGRIENQSIVLSNGTSFELSECKHHRL